ncbi:MAG TPA: PLP-dependent aminotransferase family protein [Kineosporiaceae bacterium]|nr:PLP-dependent aminotransferase family protein [Kineosporiaceae bacterium]
MSEPVIGRAELLALLGTWAADGDTLFVALADALVACVHRGDLVAGTRLPAERDLAAGLSVSRGTVTAAYDRVRSLGYAESRGGSGTRIRADVRRPLATADAGRGEGSRYRGLSARLLQPAPDVVDLALALPRSAQDLPSDFYDVPGRLVAAAAGPSGMAPQGGLPLREAVADRYSAAGLPTGAEDVVVTGGGQQALDLCAALAIRPGDTVLVEEATYPGALAVFAAHGARIRTVPVQGSWGDAGGLAEAVATHHPRLLYLMPSMHNPTGRSAVDTWRRRLAAFVDAHELYLLEDDSVADLRFDGVRLPPVAAYSRSGRVLTVGSLSKSVWGGLRIGWIRSDPACTEQFAQLKAAKDLGLSAFGQAAALHVFPRLHEVLAARTCTLARQAGVLLDLLAEHLPDWEVSAPDGGLVAWAKLPTATAEEFCQRAARFGVAVSAGATYCVGADRTDRIRLSFAEAPDVLAEGVRRLARAWSCHGASPPLTASVGRG